MRQPLSGVNIHVDVILSRSGQRLPSAHAQRLSDEVSDNRHRQRWMPADIHGRSVAGRACRGAGSPRRYLASGRRGHRDKCRVQRPRLPVSSTRRMSCPDDGGVISASEPADCSSPLPLPTVPSGLRRSSISSADRQARSGARNGCGLQPSRSSALPESCRSRTSSSGGVGSPDSTPCPGSGRSDR